MAFDAGMMAFVTREMDSALKRGKVEKIYQPTRDEIMITVKSGRTYIVRIAAGASPMIGITERKTENPEKAPMFCMLLRKNLAGARIESAEQTGFERCARITFDAYDELGFPAKKHIIAEIMGKYSNIILTDADDKIISLLKPIDLSASEIRPLLPGMKYELPPPQKRADPTSPETDFAGVLSAVGDDTPASRAITSSFLGISSSNAAELAYRAAGDSSETLGDCRDSLARVMEDFRRVFENNAPTPTLVTDAEGKPVDFSFIDLTGYSAKCVKSHPETFAELLDTFYEEKTRAERIHRRAYDVERLITNAENRLEKKLSLMREELAGADEGEKYKLWGDLLTANIYRVGKGADSAVLENYYDEMKPVKIPLDSRLTPQANAQKYYKKYQKSKSAKIHLAEQITLAEGELEYIRSVADALSRAEGETDLAQLREELAVAGYASKLRTVKAKKPKAPAYLHFRTSGGYDVYCGKNNLSNDYIRTHLASKNDWWFHVKDRPGSHVVMITDGADVSEMDFTEAATVAAVHSSAPRNAPAAVDYLRIRELKKPNGSKPGFVIYHTNWTAYVNADESLAASLAVK